MAVRHYLAIDLGASSGRTVLGRFNGDSMAMEEIHRFPTPIVEDGERLYWDLDAVWESVQVGLGRALNRAPDLVSLSVDSWGVDYVPLDRHMNPIRRAHVYRDPRASAMEAVADRRMAPESLYVVTGIRALSINTLFQVLADQVLTPPDYARTHCRLLVADYLNWRLCGRPVAEVSLASTTQLLDARTGDWARSAMRKLEIDPVAWPKVVKSGTVLGPVPDTPSVAVVAGCSHDTACAVAAVPAVGNERWAYVSSGTWSLLGVELDDPVCTEAAWRAGFTNEAGFGGSVRLLKNLTGLWVLQECERIWRAEGAQFDYEQLVAEARRASLPVGRLDFNEARFTARGNMPQCINDRCCELGFAPPDSRGAMVRLILESLASMYQQALTDLAGLLGYPASVLHVVGGGSRNAFLNQVTANACGIRVVAGPAEATALGNLLIQAAALGHLSPEQSIRDVSASSTDTVTYAPEPVR